MKARTWIPIFVGDYLADTAHLNAAQHGAYLLLIFSYWRSGGLPDDDAQLAQIARMTPAEWKKHRSVIRAFFKEGWRHSRVDAEIDKARDQYERRANAGRKGNQIRWSDAETDRNAIAMGSPSSSPSPVRLSQGEKTLGGTSFGRG